MTNKLEKLIKLFGDKDKLDIAYVLKETGIASEGALRTNLYWLRKEGIIDLRIKWGYVLKKED